MSTAVKGSIMIQGQELTITNPDKLLWPEMGITKLMYLEKLGELAPYLIKHCKDRYLTTIRYPDGIHGKSFYQKNYPQPKPEFVKLAPLGTIAYVHLESLPVLLWLGNLACLEFHASFDRISEPERPTEWIIDLDPSIEEEPRIMEAASLVGKLLLSLGIRSIPKTSGATGVQIIVPLLQDLTFDELRQIGQFVGEYMSRSHPQLFTIERMKKDRGNMIYFDYLQHYRGKTISASYTPRARKAASVSTPLAWEEVERDVKPGDYHLLNIMQRLRSKGDLIDSVPAQNLRPILQFIGH
ncbi:non-homologous end-joining DNA ligase [Paenibacillus sp. GCM10012307]|uniref:Non-homologous end-joining DNA ligase n=1 Tax=Paenibacillus roseus TaxID=2798579 RepID=A0A934J4F4_9BACL|nr:non-homologous end-joining DNA ligase [Paenibacillus roseus]MBJ6360230.1 non-homologous end-joining DNA ligase [Paenibacillus roseus]